MLFRMSKANESDAQQPDSHANLRFLNTPQRKERFSRLRGKNRVSQQHVKRLKERIELMIEEKGVQVSGKLHEDLVKTMSDNTPEVTEKHPCTWVV